jgi:hypothetical protein
VQSEKGPRTEQEAGKESDSTFSSFKNLTWGRRFFDALDGRMYRNPKGHLRRKTTLSGTSMTDDYSGKQMIVSPLKNVNLQW